MKFLRIDPKTQNHLKHEMLMRTQNIATQHLELIRTRYGDLNGLVDARKRIIGALNHNGLKDYLRPFGLDEVRSNLENVFGRLSRVAQIEETLLDDVESCQSSIRDATENSKNLCTFLAKDYLLPFLQNADRVLQEFLEQRQRQLLREDFAGSRWRPTQEAISSTMRQTEKSEFLFLCKILDPAEQLT